MSTPKADPNPYVGPNPFKRGQPLFGRDREKRELRYLLTSERIVLLYSPSGAGKSSLVNAGLLPALESRFDILGPIRVNLSPVPGVRNRYAWSCIADLEKTEQLSERNLAEYFLERKKERNQLLVFDQFEEVLRVDPTDTAVKREFFVQLGELLSEPSIWALFIIREDYLAPLDPFARLLPTHLQNRFRIDRLSRAEAEKAIELPTEKLNRKYAPGVVSTLVSNLAKVTVQNLTGRLGEGVGDYVEPVHLQVVCFDLWNEMEAEDLSIDQVDVGDVGQALSRYYAKAVLEGSNGNIDSERNMREWFEEKLITGDGVRNQVRMEEFQSGGLTNDLVIKMTEAYLVRRDERGGITWFELAHDRLVGPIRRSNQTWFKDHLSILQQRASKWRRAEEAKELLLIGKSLEEALEDDKARRKTKTLTPKEEAFVKESRDADAISRAAEDFAQQAEQRRKAEEDLAKERLKAAEERRQVAEESLKAAEERRQRDKQAKRVLMSLVAVMILLLLLSVALYFKQNEILERANKAEIKAKTQSETASKAVAKYDLQTIEGLVNKGKIPQALAYLGRTLVAISVSPELKAEAPPSVDKFLQQVLLHGALRIPSAEIPVEKPVTEVAMSGNGAHILITQDTGSSRAWDAITGQWIGKPFAGSDSIQLSQDGKLAVLFGKNRQSLMDLEKGTEQGEIFLPANLRFADFLPAPKGSKRMLFTANSGEAKVWDVDSHQPLGRTSFDASKSIGMSADRSFALVVLNQRVGRWNFSGLPSGNLDWANFGAVITEAALGPKGERAAAIVSGRTKVLVSGFNNARTIELRDIQSAEHVGFTQDGKKVVVTWTTNSPETAWLGVWDAASGNQENKWPATATSKLEFKSGMPVFVESAAEGLTLRDISTGEPVAQVLTRGPVSKWALSSDGKRLATSTEGGKQVELWDVSKGKNDGAEGPSIQLKGLTKVDAEALAELAKAAGGMMVEAEKDPASIPLAQRREICKKLKEFTGLTPGVQALIAHFLSSVPLDK